MKKKWTSFIAAAEMALLVALPAAAQSAGQGGGIGLFAVNFCEPFIQLCPAGVPPLGICVSIVTMCNDALKTGNSNLLDVCCEQCSEGTALCGIDPSICTLNFGCEF